MREWSETSAALKPASINVDVIGVGAGVADRLLELGLPLVSFNMGETQHRLIPPSQTEM